MKESTMTNNEVGLPPVADASTGLGPIPDTQMEMTMSEKPEEKITVVGTSGEAVAKKKPGRKPGTKANGKKVAAVVVPEAAVTRCSVRVRYCLRRGNRTIEVQANGKAKSPQLVQALFLKWAREIETRWAKL